MAVSILHLGKVTGLQREHSLSPRPLTTTTKTHAFKCKQCKQIKSVLGWKMLQNVTRKASLIAEDSSFRIAKKETELVDGRILIARGIDETGSCRKGDG